MSRTDNVGCHVLGQILEKSLEFEFVAGDYPAGEQWPWIYFRIAPKHFD